MGNLFASFTENMPSYNEVQEALQLATEKSYNHWVHHDLFTWKWWMLLAALIVPWVIWCKIADRRRFSEQFQLGLLWIVVSVGLDVSGVNLNLWSYPDRLVWFFPPLIPADLATIPVAYMIAFQFFRGWKSYAIANLVLAACFSFVIEPLFIRLGILEMKHWTHWYSFLLFSLIGIFIRRFVLYINSKTERAGV